MTEREGCGSCTMCCKLMGVADLPKPKPNGVWCEHCAIGKGCKIYEERPNSCRIYECLWLMSQKQAHPMHPQMRPDRSKVIMSVTNPSDSGQQLLTVHVDPGKPNAWREEPIYSYFCGIAKQGVRLIIGAGINQRRRTVLSYNKISQQIEESEGIADPPAEDGSQQVFLKRDI